MESDISFHRAVRTSVLHVSIGAKTMTRFALAIGLLLFVSGATAQPSPFSPVIAGVPVYCTSYSGQPVALIPDYYLPDVGQAIPGNPPIIKLNPNVLSRMTPLMQIFWYGHECAHHLLGPANSEINADCWSIRTMRDQGILRRQQVPELMAQISSTSGSMWGHLPGPYRAQHFANCFDSN